MDSEVDDLIAGLCTRAGMMLEDASARAVDVGALSTNDPSALITTLIQSTKHAGALLQAAQILAGHCRSDTSQADERH